MTLNALKAAQILIVAHHFPPHISGVGNVAQKQASSLAKKGFDVTVLSSDCSSRPGLENNINGYKVYRVRASNALETKLGAPFPLFSPSLVWRTYVSVKHADLVHIHDTTYISSLFTALFARLLRKPLFLTQHVTIVQHDNKLAMAAQKLIYATSAKFIFNISEKIVVYNLNVKNFLIDHGVQESKILQNYNGIDTVFFSPAKKTEKEALRLKYDIPLEKPVVLFVGRLVPKKGFDLVFGAKSNNYTTLLVGNGNVPEHMSKSKDVIFFGPATQEQLADLYRLSDVFVCPTEGEVFTLVMQEAMSCGLPVIATDDSGYSHYDLNRELLNLIARNTQALRQSIEELLSSDKKYLAMSKYSRSYSLENFSWQHNYAKEFSIYKDRL